MAAGLAMGTAVQYSAPFQVQAPAGTWASWNTLYSSGTAVYVGTASTAGDQAWAQWNYLGTTTGGTFVINPVNVGGWGAWNTVYEETREQREAREAAEAVRRREMEERLAEQRVRQAEQQRERAAARERALELLGFWLTAEQLVSYQTHGWFEVRSSKGRRWRIRDRGQAGNVDLMPEIGEERDATYCAHPPDSLPDADAHLAQALALVTDEDAFLRVANCRYQRAAA